MPTDGTPRRHRSTSGRRGGRGRAFVLFSGHIGPCEAYAMCQLCLGSPEFNTAIYLFDQDKSPLIDLMILNLYQFPRSIILMMSVDESSSSDSSDLGESFKNVRCCLATSRENAPDSADENYAYKRKLGDLIFDANYEGGNLGFVERVDEYDYDLMVRPDVANPRHRVWFNFTVSNQRPNQCVVLTIVNLSDYLNLLNEGLTPVVRSRHRPDWVRLDENQVFYYRSLSHNNRRVLSMAFRFDELHDNQHQFALFYPYTITTLASFISRWSIQIKRTQQMGANRVALSENKLDFQVNLMGHSILNKPIYELRVLGGQAGDQQKLTAIVIVGNCGCLNPAGSYVCQGVLDFILSNDPVARATRNHVNLTVVPMLDPDSSWIGNSSTDLMGQSMSLTSKLVELNPNLYGNYRIVRERLGDICANSKRGRVVIIELMTNLDLIGSRLVGFNYSDSFRMAKHLHFARLMSIFSEAFYLEDCLFHDNATQVTQNNESGMDDTRLFDLTRYGNLDHYRLEVSPMGYFKRSLTCSERHRFTQEKYLLLGRSLVYSLLELTRPKRDLLEPQTARHLDSFYPKSDDLDDLLLVHHLNKPF